MIKKVVVNGASGVLGSQIALQTAVGGCEVIGYCLNDQEVQHAKHKMTSYIKAYDKGSVKGYTSSDAQKALESITFTTDLGLAVKDADLLIEAIIEDLDVKRGFFAELAALDVPEKTIFVTNTSSLRPSAFMEETGREDRFLALHYMNEIWKHNVVEAMPTSETSEETVKTVMEFAARVGMEPVLIKKEKPGYIINSLIIPYLNQTLYLWGSHQASPWDIDRAWMKALQLDRGPFASLDVMGFKTPLNIGRQLLQHGGVPQSQVQAREYTNNFLADMIAMNRMGRQTSEGFYHYHDKPEYLHEDFLAETPDISYKDFGQETGDEVKDKAIRLFTTVATGLMYGGFELALGEYAHPDAIDKVWTMTFDGSPGPFDLIKKIGAQQVHDVLQKHFQEQGQGDELHKQILEALKQGDF